RLLTARGISTSRARRNGLPPSRASAWAKSSSRASRAAASFSSHAARSLLGSADQAGKARRAAATALSTSAALPRATSAKGLPPAGSKTWSQPLPAGSRAAPSIQWLNRIGVAYIAAAAAPSSDGLHAAAVDGQAGAVDIAGRGRAEESDDAADFRRAGETPGGNGLAHALEDGFRGLARRGRAIAHDLLDPPGFGIARQHVVDGDAEGCQFARQGLGPARDRAADGVGNTEVGDRLAHRR